AGYKYFYLDIWRYEAWHEKLGSVFDLGHIPDQRNPCTACVMGCYRSASTLMHSSIAASDALAAAARGDLAAAAATLFRRGVALSAWALVREAPQIRRLANRKAKLRPVRAAREMRGTGMGRTAL
ncbi:MAG: hypothetical protein JO118_12615, partial [Acetobacteraceae bacterium]|nr:hypothetical protein [Acetobacteraceae bacterium]